MPLIIARPPGQDFGRRAHIGRPRTAGQSISRFRAFLFRFAATQRMSTERYYFGGKLPKILPMRAGFEFRAANLLVVMSR